MEGIIYRPDNFIGKFEGLVWFVVMQHGTARTRITNARLVAMAIAGTIIKKNASISRKKEG